MKLPLRTGFGFDVHAFAENRKLILGGVEIAHNKGLLGHSDADVLLHAISDALLGALALGDIGKHFPETDPKFKDYDSKKILTEVYDMIISNGYIIGNVDAVVALERPKISPYVEIIKMNIAKLLNCEPDRVSIKATTTEKLGFTGREEGAAAYASVLILKTEEDD